MATMSDFEESFNYKKYPSIFMPKWATRIWLEITSVGVERVQEMDIYDVQKEGVVVDSIAGFSRMEKLWDSLNAKRGYGWNKNPWVWVIGFRVCS